MTMLRVTTQWGGLGGGQPWYSTHHFAGDTSAEAATATAALATFWGAVDNVLSNLITWSILEDVEIVNEVTGDITSLATGTATTGAGTVTSPTLPWATQGLIGWRTGIYVDGRELRGRTYIPALTTAALLSGAPTTAVMTTLDNAADSLIADVNSTLLIWQRPREADPVREIEARVGSFAIVNSAAVSPKFAVLRSRRD